MTPVCVYSIVRNEASRHLRLALTSARAVADASDGCVVVWDDASDDDTPTIAEQYADAVHRGHTPMFWRHEGAARQRAYDAASAMCADGWWMLALDADEQVVDPARLAAAVEALEGSRWQRARLPIFEMWTPTEHRVDGMWHGSGQTRVFRWQPGGTIRRVHFACGQTPTYARSGPQADLDVHLLHWGYVRPDDRTRKHRAYVTRPGGHRHRPSHVNSIVAEAVTKPYPRPDVLPAPAELGL